MKKRILSSLLICLMVCVFCVNNACADQGSDVQANSIKALEKLVNSLQSQLVAQNKEMKSLQGELANLVNKKSTKDLAKQEKLEEQVKCLERDLEELRVDKATSYAKPGAPIVTDTMPAWLEGLNFSGDIRLRYQADFKRGGNRDRHRAARLRLRYGFTKQITDELMAEFKIGTGNYSGDRDSENATLGYDNASGGFDKVHLWLDRAYMKYNPEWMDGLTLYGGKYPENWKNHCVLYCPTPTGVDGIGQSMTFNVSDATSINFNTAQLIVSENSTKDADSELYVFDLGFKTKLGEDYNCLSWGMNAVAYLFDGWVEAGSSELGTGNGSLMKNPRVVVGSMDVGFNLGDTPVSFFALGAMNVNEKVTSGIQNQKKGWAAGVTLNALDKVGDWSLFYQYAYLEENVMAGSLIDTDLGAGHEGHWLSGSYRVLEQTDFNVTLIMPRGLGDIAGSDSGSFEDVFCKFQILTRF